MAQFINFGMFNLPFVGTNLCGYQPEVTDEELCARYFQLSVISPMAVWNSMHTESDFNPYTFSDKAKQSILSSLAQRFRFMSYMRANLFDMSRELVGGALHTPLFAWDQASFTEDVQPAKDLSSVMFGPAIKADFMFKQFTDMKQVLFP